jgi:hypothetical protein
VYSCLPSYTSDERIFIIRNGILKGDPNWSRTAILVKICFHYSSIFYAIANIYKFPAFTY